jgi:type III secretory pathway lipoprotein EscJ
VAPELVFYRDGQVEGVKYDRIGVVLINAVKEQQAQIEQQKEQLKRQQEQN